jgi:GGDEF domain-containing protein
VFERILNAIGHFKIKQESVRYSIGVSHLTADTQSLNQLLSFAQQALEEAKSSPINQVQYRPC